MSERSGQRARFVAIASRLMRQILVQYARTRRAGKRNGGLRISLEDIKELPIAGDDELVALDDALEELTRIWLRREMKRAASS
jgi:ECF sigma factor